MSELLSTINPRIIAFALGGLMMYGAFKMMTNENSTKFDQDSSFFLMVMAMVAFAVGMGIIDTQSIMNLWPDGTEGEPITDPNTEIEHIPEPELQ